MERVPEGELMTKRIRDHAAASAVRRPLPGEPMNDTGAAEFCQTAATRCDPVSAALRRALTRGAFGVALARHGHDLTALAAANDTTAVLARLDDAPPYTPTRDGLLADLLRLHRRCGDGAVIAALLYALRGSALRLSVRLDRAMRDPAEREAEVLHALTLAANDYDPERRSPHIQASIERDAWNQLWRVWQADCRRRANHARACEVVGHAATGLALGDYTLDDLLGPREPSARLDLDAEELVVAVDRLRGLVAHDVLDERDVVLLVRTRLGGEALASVAADLGLRVETVKKALYRARQNLRARRALVEALCLSPSPAGATLSP